MLKIERVIIMGVGEVSDAVEDGRRWPWVWTGLWCHNLIENSAGISLLRPPSPLLCTVSPRHLLPIWT